MGRISKLKRTDAPFRKWRINQGLTVQAFADMATRLGKATDANTVWSWDRGACIPSPNNRKDLIARFPTIVF